MLEKKDRKVLWHLSDEEKLKELHKRSKSSSILGSFYEFNNLLFCMGAPYLQTTSVDVSNTRLQSVHAQDYLPTFAELFETMARQTQSSVRYEPTFMSKWIVVPPAMPLPYSLKLEDGWKVEDRGLYVAYIPTLQPVGMDVYMLGRYSGLSREKTIESRNLNALMFAKMFDKTVTVGDMEEVKLSNCDALFFKAKATIKKDCQWRQWSFLKDGQAFVIVSALDNKNADVLLPQVERMVASFQLVGGPAASPGLQ
ncbi:MAG: hypothetical protein WC714_12200 [Candidatus Obscuribacterales bacterium]